MSAPKPDSRNTPTRLRRWREGNAVSAAHLNESVEAIDRLRRVTTQASEIVNGSAALQVTQQFRVESVEGDYLRCFRLDGTHNAEDAGGVVYVAKPYMLRRTPFDTAANGGDALVRNGISYEYTSNTERTATDTDDNTESQVLVPSYQQGDVIYATSNVSGFTMRVVNALGASVRVDWLDENRDGRAWAEA